MTHALEVYANVGRTYRILLTCSSLYCFVGLPLLEPLSCYSHTLLFNGITPPKVNKHPSPVLYLNPLFASMLTLLPFMILLISPLTCHPFTAITSPSIIPYLDSTNHLISLVFWGRITCHPFLASPLFPSVIPYLDKTVLISLVSWGSLTCHFFTASSLLPLSYT